MKGVRPAGPPISRKTSNSNPPINKWELDEKIQELLGIVRQESVKRKGE